MSDVEGTEIEAVWEVSEQVPPFAVNQFLVQFAGEDEFVLTLGHVLPPVLRGTPAERMSQARQTPTVPIQALGRFSMTRARLEELHGLLDEYLKMAEVRIR